MKKVLLASAFVVAITTASFAQTTTKENKQTSHKTTVTAKQPKANAATSAKSDTAKHMVKTKSSSSKKRHTK